IRLSRSHRASWFSFVMSADDLEQILVAHVRARGGACLMSELGGTSGWKQGAAEKYRSSLQSFLEERRHIFLVERRSKTVRLKDAVQTTRSLDELKTSRDGLMSSLSLAQREERKAQVVTHFVAHLASSPTGSCDMQELAMLPAWLQGGIGLGKLKGFLERQSDFFQVLDQGNGRSDIRLKRSPASPCSAQGAALALQRRASPSGTVSHSFGKPGPSPDLPSMSDAKRMRCLIARGTAPRGPRWKEIIVYHYFRQHLVDFVLIVKRAGCLVCKALRKKQHTPMP
ncbi:unnamed protein product, partial [Effrenium voratum]